MVLVSATSYRFHKLGFTLKISQTLSGQNVALAYVAENCLARIPRTDIATKRFLFDGAGASIIYDAEDRLLAITTAGVITKFLYDGTDIIAEFDNSNNLLRKYVHGGGTDEPLVWYEGANKYFLHADSQGSITSTTDGNGTVINISTYDAYGKRTASNDNYSSRFSYTGQAYLKEISLYYYKARIYNQNLGRFMQTDPIGYGDGMNWYNYTGSDPVNGTDPSGMTSCGDNPACEDVVVRGIRRPTSAGMIGGGGSSFGGGTEISGLPQFAMLPCTGSYCYSALIPDPPDNSEAKRKECEGLLKGISTPPGVSIKENMSLAKKNFGNASWFKSQVQNNGPWDYKQIDSKNMRASAILTMVQQENQLAFLMEYFIVELGGRSKKQDLVINLLDIIWVVNRSETILKIKVILEKVLITLRKVAINENF